MSLTQEWESTSLTKYIKGNLSLSKMECLAKIIGRLQELQICLPKDNRADTILNNKFLNASDRIDECRLGRQKIAPTVEG